MAVLELTLEANTFSTRKTTIASMNDDEGILRGQELVERYSGSSATVAGFLDPDIPADVEIVPLVGYRGGANGEFTAAAYDEATKGMLTALRNNGPFDAVLLSLHGAAVAENAENADLETVVRVRAAIGPRVLIGVVLDMHCNVGAALLDTVDVLRIYQTNPHVDAKDQALECRAMVLEILRGASKPATAFVPLPLVINIVRQDTSREPLAAILARCRELEQVEGMLDVSVAEGFPYADVEQMGVSVVASHRFSLAAAQAAVSEIGGLLWDCREELQGTGATPEQALLRLDHSRGGKPTLLLDVGDNVGGGSRGDSTTILSEAMRLSCGGLLFSLWDPETVACLATSAIGARVDVSVGGRSAEQEGAPQPLTATLIARSEGRYEDPGPTHGGFRHYNAGPTVALRTDNNVVVVLTSLSSGTTSPVQFRSLGIEPGDFAGIVAKGVNSPKAGFAPICGEQVMVDTPGVTRLSVEKFSYIRRRRPMFPFERGATYP
ncbi:MAG: M81 family metallopeptidase [Streptosporangiaceae bacterium]